MRRWVITMLAGAVLAAACGNDADDPTAEATTTTERSTTTTEATGAGPELAPIDGPVVELLDAGAEPRVELRLDPTEGETFAVTMRQGQSFELAIGDQRERSETVHELDVVYEVVSVTEDEIEAIVRYEDARVIEADDEARPLLEDMLGRFAGLEAGVVFDRHGRIVAATTPDLDLSDMPELEGFIDSLGEQMASFATPFPTEAVGVGARWQVTSTADFAGVFSADTVIVLTLTELTDEVATATAEVRMDITGTTPGVEIVSADLGGGGTMEWLLQGVVGTSEQQMGGTMVMEAQGQRIEQTMAQTISIRPR